MSGYPISDEVQIEGNLAGGVDLRAGAGRFRLSSAIGTTSYAVSLPPTAGATGQYLRLTSPSTSVWGAGPSAGALETWYIRHVLPSGTNGGADSNFGTRPLNTLDKRPGVGTDVQLAVAPAGANQILVQPGTYMVRVYTPVASYDNMGLQLVDVTNAVNLLVSSNNIADAGSFSQVTCFLTGTIVVSTQIVAELQTTLGLGSTGALNRGVPTGIGGRDEVYTQIRFTKIQ